jgi:exoribonuclease R
VRAAFGQLPEVMAHAEQVANGVDRAVIDLAEAVMLAERVGDVFDAAVVDEDERGAVVQLVDPAVIARVPARRVEPGDRIRVRLTAADPVGRTVSFERVS